MSEVGASMDAVAPEAQADLDERWTEDMTVAELMMWWSAWVQQVGHKRLYRMVQSKVKEQ